ncbi:MAG: hypothetical protein IH973_12695 [Myxococcales bacterium]|nr:hypothetical protein [Myxococcales bacterium]
MLQPAFGRFVKVLKPQGLPGIACTQEMLKSATASSDEMRMFMPCPEEPPVPESAIAGFCVALNTPVVNIEMLDVEPARAGILLAANDYGDLILLVRVSLVSSGEGVTFKFQGDPADFGNTAAALDAALSFSEGMGFLFDEDLLSQGNSSGRSRASKIWHSLCAGRPEPNAEVDVAKRKTPPPAAVPHAKASEIELTSTVQNGESKSPIKSTASASIADLLTQSFVESVDEVLRDETPREIAMGSQVLTKFRERRKSDRRSSTRKSEAHGEGAQVAVPPRPGSEILARVAIESERLGNEFVDDSGFLTRLLSSF